MEVEQIRTAVRESRIDIEEAPVAAAKEAWEQLSPNRTDPVIRYLSGLLEDLQEDLNKVTAPIAQVRTAGNTASKRCTRILGGTDSGDGIDMLRAANKLFDQGEVLSEWSDLMRASLHEIVVAVGGVTRAVEAYERVYALGQEDLSTAAEAQAAAVQSADKYLGAL